MSNDSVHHERMPQDPIFVAEQKTTSPAEPVVTKSKKRRSKCIDASNNAPRRRSLRIQRQSLCAEGREIPPSFENNLKDNNAAGMNDSQDKQDAGEYQVKVTYEGNLTLAQTLAEVVIDLVGSASSGDQDEHAAITESSDRNTTATIIANSVDCESSESNTTRHRKKAKVKSVLESLEPVEKENSLNCDRLVKLSSSSSRKKRRDTFDLSRKRGLTRSGSVHISDVGVDQNKTYPKSTSMELKIDTDEVADLKPPAANISAGQANETWTDMITPKNGSNEVQLPNNFSNEISSSSADDPDEIRGSLVVRENLRNLSSVAVEEEMRSKFSEFSVYNYVSDLVDIRPQSFCICLLMIPPPLFLYLSSLVYRPGYLQ